MQDNPLAYLIEVKTAFKSHADSVDKVLCKSDGSVTQSDAALRELAKVFYAPFKTHTAKYGDREKQLLLAELSAGSTTSKDIIDELRNVSTSVPKLVGLFKEASRRCCDLTEGCAFPSLIAALETCLKSYVERYWVLMKRLDKRKSAAHSWNIFQQSLSLNQTSGELILQLEQLDITYVH